MDTHSSCTRRGWPPLALLGAVLAGCAVGQPLPAAAPAPAAPATAQVSAAPAAGTMEALRALVGSAACSSSAQCRTVPLGAKPCGGPEAYLAWSTQVTDEAALLREAEAYAARRRAENERSGRASDCRFVGDPGARCVPSEPATGTTPAPGVCRLNPGSAAPAGAR